MDGVRKEHRPPVTADNTFVFRSLLRDVSLIPERRGGESPATRGSNVARRKPGNNHAELLRDPRRVRERRAMDFALLLLVMLLRQEGECFHLRELSALLSA